MPVLISLALYQIFGFAVHILDNEIDGDAFVLLISDSMKSMISKQGLLLKFQHKFNEFHPGSSLTEKVDSNNPVSVEEKIQVAKDRSSKSNQQGLSLDVIREGSQIFGRGKSSRSKKTISSWQKAVNDAAFRIAQQSPDRMYDRAQLKFDAE